MLRKITFCGALSFFAITHNASIHAQKINDDISSGAKILFCTKEISISAVIQFSDNASGKGPDPAGHIVEDQNIVRTVHASLSHRLKSRFFDTRHCFLANAFVIKNRNNTFSLSGLLAQGYAGDPKRGLAQSGRQAGQSYSELFTGNETVACMPILSGDDAVVDETWEGASRFMRQSTMKEGYHPVDYNCCTAAYKAAQFVGCDLSEIDPSSFNFRGVGVSWNTIHNSLSSSMGRFSSGAASILAVPINFSEALKETKTGSPSSERSDSHPAELEKKEQGDDTDL